VKYQHAEPADRKAKRIRRAIAKMYDKDPAKAIAHVNERLDVANQIEANRAAYRDAR
jgi:hypothetical protein